MTMQVTSDCPITKSQWMWPQGQLYLYNLYADFRYDFDLKNLPGTAPFYITADQAYQLYVNGEYVCRGPARGYQEHWPLDQVDLLPFLKTGHNWIAVRAYNPGISTFAYIHKAAAGLICAGVWPDAQITIYSGTKDWKARREPGIRRLTARQSLQLAFQEDVDASQQDESWIYNEHADLSSWPEWWHGDSEWNSQGPYGRPPHDSLEERLIPLMREAVVVPEKAFAACQTPSVPGWDLDENISYQWRQEVIDHGNWQPAEMIAPVI